MCDLQRFNAFAADTGGYRALVCVFLFGGMDCHDTVIPYDTFNYNQYSTIRRSLLNEYVDLMGGSTRTRERLLPHPISAAGNSHYRRRCSPCTS